MDRLTQLEEKRQLILESRRQPRLDDKCCVCGKDPEQRYVCVYHRKVFCRSCLILDNKREYNLKEANNCTRLLNKDCIFEVYNGS